jgi:hypothetical protein
MSKNPNDKENTIPYEQIDAGHMRRDAEHKGSTDPEKHAKHESELHKLDKGEGAIKGGR